MTPRLRVELHRDVYNIEQPQPEPRGFFAVSSAWKGSAAWIFPMTASPVLSSVSFAPMHAAGMTQEDDLQEVGAMRRDVSRHGGT